jgi:type III secretion apparatus needle protein
MSGINFNYGQVTNTLGQSASTKEAELASFTKTMDPGSAADMIKLQHLTQQWNVAINLQSATVKMIGDALKGIVQKVG